MRSLFLFLLFILMASFSAKADPVVASGGRVRLAALATINPTCQSIGPINVRIVQRPRVGSLVVDHAMGYPHFSPFHVKSYCNGTMVPVARVIYQAPRGFVGADEVSFEMIGAMGDYHGYHFNISVVPGLVGSGAVVIPPQGPVMGVPAAGMEEPAPRAHRHHHRVAAVEHSMHAHKHASPAAPQKKQQQAPLDI